MLRLRRRRGRCDWRRRTAGDSRPGTARPAGRQATAPTARAHELQAVADGGEAVGAVPLVMAEAPVGLGARPLWIAMGPFYQQEVGGEEAPLSRLRASHDHFLRFHPRNGWVINALALQPNQSVVPCHFALIKKITSVKSDSIQISRPVAPFPI